MLLLLAVFFVETRQKPVSMHQLDRELPLFRASLLLASFFQAVLLCLNLRSLIQIQSDLLELIIRSAWLTTLSRFLYLPFGQAAPFFLGEG